MSLNQFAEAANDFTAVIRLNPRIARLKKKVKGVEEISPQFDASKRQFSPCRRQRSPAPKPL